MLYIHVYVRITSWYMNFVKICSVVYPTQLFTKRYTLTLVQLPKHGNFALDNSNFGVDCLLILVSIQGQFAGLPWYCWVHEPPGLFLVAAPLAVRGTTWYTAYKQQKMACMYLAVDFGINVWHSWLHCSGDKQWSFLWPYCIAVWGLPINSGNCQSGPSVGHSVSNGGCASQAGSQFRLQVSSTNSLDEEKKNKNKDNRIIMRPTFFQTDNDKCWGPLTGQLLQGLALMCRPDWVSVPGGGQCWHSMGSVAHIHLVISKVSWSSWWMSPKEGVLNGSKISRAIYLPTYLAGM